VDVVVRRATAVDAPGLARLRWRWRIEDRGEHGEIDRESFVDFFTTWTLDHAGTHRPFVAEVDGQLCGMAWLALSYRVPSPRGLDRRAGDIQSVYVVPERRGLGVGAQLIRAVIQHCRDTELAYLTVHSAHAATDFYQKLGFIDDELWMSYDIGSR
jgi:GNAT superfamily N-acetyltransferase